MQAWQSACFVALGQLMFIYGQQDVVSLHQPDATLIDSLPVKGRAASKLQVFLSFTLQPVPTSTLRVHRPTTCSSRTVAMWTSWWHTAPQDDHPGNSTRQTSALHLQKGSNVTCLSNSLDEA